MDSASDFASRAKQKKWDDSCLLVVLKSPDLKLFLVPLARAGQWHVSGVQYRDLGGGSFTGFYDWLRSREGTLLGVRYLPQGPAEAILRNLREGKQFTLSPEKTWLDIFLSDMRDYDQTRTDLQSFGNNWVVGSARGDQYAISFGLSDLTDEDRAHLMALGAISSTQ